MSMGSISLAANTITYGAVPALVDDATLVTAWFPVTNVIRIWAIILLGVSDIEVDAAIQQATDTSGTSAKALSRAASITQLADDDDGSWATIDVEVTAAHFDLANSFNHAALVITVGNGSVGSYVAGIVIAWVRHRPPSQHASNVEQVEIAG